MSIRAVFIEGTTNGTSHSSSRSESPYLSVLSEHMEETMRRSRETIQ